MFKRDVTKSQKPAPHRASRGKDRKRFIRAAVETHDANLQTGNQVRRTGTRL